MDILDSFLDSDRPWSEFQAPSAIPFQPTWLDSGTLSEPSFKPPGPRPPIDTASYQQPSKPTRSKSTDYNDMIFAASERHGVDPAYIKAKIRTESNFNPNAVSAVGAKGLMQIMDATGKDLGITDPFDPDQSIDKGTEYFAGLYKKYDGDTRKASAAYNAGSRNIDKAVNRYGDKWLENLHKVTGTNKKTGKPHAEETRKYVKKISKYYDEYKKAAPGKRADGTKKGKGFLGELPTSDGKGYSTEISIGVKLDGKETEIPLLVPTLEQAEIEYLLSGNKPSEEITQKAVDHAKTRMSKGLSPFAQDGEQAPGQVDPLDAFLDSDRPWNEFQKDDDGAKTPSWFKIVTKSIASGLANVNVSLARGARDVIKAADYPSRMARETFGIEQEDPGVKFLEEYMASQQKQQAELDISPELSELPWYIPKRIVGTGLQAIPQVALVAGAALMAPQAIAAKAAAVALGTIAYGSSAEEAKAEGASEVQQVLHGITAAEIEVITELPVFGAVGKLWKYLKAGGVAEKAGVSFITKLLKGFGLFGVGMAFETVQEMDAYLGGQMSKRLHYDPDAPITIKALKEAGYGGATMSAVMFGFGAPGMAARLAIKPKKADIDVSKPLPPTEDAIPPSPAIDQIRAKFESGEHTAEDLEAIKEIWSDDAELSSSIDELLKSKAEPVEPTGAAYKAQKKRQTELSKEFAKYEKEIADAEQEKADDARFKEIRLSSEQRQKVIEDEFKSEIAAEKQDEKVETEISGLKAREIERAKETEARKGQVTPEGPLDSMLTSAEIKQIEDQGFDDWRKKAGNKKYTDPFLDALAGGMEDRAFELWDKKARKPGEIPPVEPKAKPAEEAIAKPEKIEGAPPEAPVDRRKAEDRRKPGRKDTERRKTERRDVVTRKALDELSPEEQGFVIPELRRMLGVQKKAALRQERIADSDPLTGLKNRRGLKKETAKREKEGKETAHTFIDLVGFKGLNDFISHEAGDETLMFIAKAMKSIGLENPTRWGGDELMFQAESSEAGDTDAQKLHDYFEKNPLRLRDKEGKEYDLTVMFRHGTAKGIQEADEIAEAAKETEPPEWKRGEVHPGLKEVSAKPEKVVEAKVPEVVEPKMKEEVKTVYDEAIKLFPDDIKNKINVKSIRIVEFPNENKGEGGRLHIDGKDNYHIILERGEENLTDTLQHELLHAYVLEHPELTKGKGFFGHEKAVDKIHKELKAKKPTPEAVEGERAKEPWEMTEGEYVKTYKPTRHFQKYTSEQRTERAASQRLTGGQREAKGEYFYTNEFEDIAYDTAKEAKTAAHAYIIKQALSEGKPVPEEVLKDYPDLKPTPAPEKTDVALEGEGVEKAKVVKFPEKPKETPKPKEVEKEPLYSTVKEVEPVSIDISSLSKEILSRMNRTLKSKGYDVRGSDDIKQLLEKRGLINDEGKLWQPDWIDAYQKAIGTVEKRKSTEAKKSELKNINWQRLKELGKTTNLKEAGYIVPDGSLTDLSGKREGGQSGEKALDHREAGGTVGMQEIMSYGYIRMGYLKTGFAAIDISKEPTSKQYSVLRDLISRANGDITLDLEEGLGELEREGSYYKKPARSFNENYNEGTKPARIINDIKRFFEGEDPIPLKGQYYSTAASKEKTDKNRVLDIVIPHIQGMTNFPTVQVVQSIDQLPKNLKEKVAAYSKKSNKQVEGFYDKDGDQVFLIANNLSEGRIEAVLRHEAEGHRGIRLLLGSELDGFLDGIAEAKKEGLLAHDPGLDFKDQEAVRVAADEWIARKIEAGNLSKSFWDDLVRIFRKWLRKLVPNLDLTDREIRSVLVDTVRNVREGRIDRMKEGEGAPLYSMAGKKAIGADKGALASAQKMLAEGRDEEEVWKETGWLKGAEGEYRFEIDDSGAKWAPGFLAGIKTRLDKTLKLKDVLKHPVLYKAYPELKDINFVLTSLPFGDNATYNPKTNIIKMNSTQAVDIEREGDVQYAATKTLLHEVQHAIQAVEGFATGGSLRTFSYAKKYYINGEETSDMEGGKGVILRYWEHNKELKGLEKEFKTTLREWKQRLKKAKRLKTKAEYQEKVTDWEEAIRLLPEAKDWKIEVKSLAFEKYRRLAGEIEARDTAARAKLTPEQRREQMPYESQGIPKSDWIVTDGNGTSFSVESPKRTLATKELSVKQRVFLEKHYPEKLEAFDKEFKRKSGGSIPQKNKDDSKAHVRMGETPSAPEGFNMPHEGKGRQVFDLLQFKIQDRLNSLRKVQKTIEKQTATEIPDNTDAYQTEELYHGKVSRRMGEFDTDHLDPLVDSIHESDFGLEDIEEFGYARHAPEANKRLKEINPKRKDNEALSGMSNKHAEKIMAKYGYIPDGVDWKKIGGNEVMPNIIKRIDAIIKKTLDILVDEGLATSGQIAAWRATYKYYVPLKREDKAIGMPKKGKGMDIGGPESKKRMTGSAELKAVNILANIVAQHEAAIIRAEKAKVGRAMLSLAETNPSKELWQVDAPELKPFLKQRKSDEIDETTGLPATLSEVVFGKDILYKFNDNVLVVKVEGEERTITFNDKNVHAQRIVRSLKNLGADNSNAVINTLATVNRFLAIVNTSANPEFILSNFTRDIQTAGYNINDTEAKNIKARIFKDVFRALQGIRKGVREDYSSEWAKNYKDFAKAGAQTGWTDHYKNIEDREKSLRKKLNLLKDGKWGSVQRAAKGLFEFVSNENTAVENAIRLSTYTHLKRIGVSQAKAASAAKNLTVNFNRRGDMGQALNALYLFFNANVQGSARLIYAAVRSPTVRKMMYGTVAFAVMLDILNRAIGGEDDDGEKRYDKVPSWVKEHNLVLMRPNGDYFKLPLPWGYNTLHVLGQSIGEAVDPNKDEFDAMAAAGRLVSAVVGSFNPLGSESSLWQIAAPTIADPFVQWRENQNFAGIPIKPEQLPFDVPKPEYQMYWQNSQRPSRWITKKFNDLTGGDEVKPGLVNVSPEVIDLFVDTLSGGAGRFIDNTISLPGTLTKKDIEVRRIPFIRKVYGESPDYYLRTKFYDNSGEIKYAEKSMKHYEDDKEMTASTKRKYAWELRFVNRMRRDKTAIRSLRKKRRIFENQKGLSEGDRERKIEEIERKVTEIMTSFNRTYKGRKGQKRVVLPSTSRPTMPATQKPLTLRQAMRLK